MRTTLIWSLLVVCPLSVGCKSKKKKPESAPRVSEAAGLAANAQEPPCEFDITLQELEPDPCPTWDCGSNSPIVGGLEYDLDGKSRYVILGFDPSSRQPTMGKPTIQKGSLTNPTSILPLSVRAGALMAGDTAIDDKGWWFLVQDTQDKQRCKVDVSNITQVQPWYGDKTVPAYTLEVGLRTGRTKLCRRSDTWGSEMRRRAHSGDRGSGHEPDENSTNEGSYGALLIAGERYMPKARIRPEESNEYAPWFNIACAGTALAKMRLMGLDPEADTKNETKSDRQTVLKMLTAAYRQVNIDKDWTEPGVKLALSKCTSPKDCTIDLAPEGNQTRTLEAYWNNKGAICFTHTRLGESAVPETKVPTKCENPVTPDRAQACEDLIRQESSGGPAGQLGQCPDNGSAPSAWKTEAINHVEH